MKEEHPDGCSNASEKQNSVQIDIQSEEQTRIIKTIRVLYCSKEAQTMQADTGKQA